MVLRLYRQKKREVNFAMPKKIKDKTPQNKKEKYEETGLFSQGWYNTLHYQVVPPLFVVLFTAAVQWLALLGNPPCPFDVEQCDRIKGNQFSWTVVGIYIMWVIIWLRVPAKKFIGPESPEGELPTYHDNGFLFYCVTIAAFIGAQIIWPSLSHELVQYFPELLASLSLIALVLCVWLVIKARIQGKGSDTPILYDFYRGSELHPHVLGCDAKQLAVSRIGMMGWQLLIIAAFLDSQFLAPDVATLTMQTIYIAKFFWWESGYFTTLDITYDRAGYYLCWGGIVWIPALFPVSQLYVAQYGSTMSPTMSLITTALALGATALEYDIDRQKEVFVEWRQKYVKGEVKPYKVWGHPVKFIEVNYTNTSGTSRPSALLTDGFWGLARHCNYTCELLISLLWCLPSATGHIKFIPLLYFYFIASLIVHRILRDEHKCSAKYGKYWQEYCRLVPYRFIPYLF